MHTQMQRGEFNFDKPCQHTKIEGKENKMKFTTSALTIGNRMKGGS